MAKVRTLLSHCEVTLLIGAPGGQGQAKSQRPQQQSQGAGGSGEVWPASPEEPGVLHVLGIVVIRLLRAQAHPEEVLRLLAFADDLRVRGWLSSGSLPASLAHGHCLPGHLLAVGGLKHGVQYVLRQLGLVRV